MVEPARTSAACTVAARDWPGLAGWGIGLAAPVLGGLGFYLTDLVLGLVWPGTRDGLGAAVAFALFWWLLIWVIPVWRAHRAGRWTSYVVAGGELRYERGPTSRGVPVGRVEALWFEPTKATARTTWSMWPHLAPYLMVRLAAPAASRPGADAGPPETMAFSRIALWRKSHATAAERELRRACGLPADGAPAQGSPAGEGTS